MYDMERAGREWRAAEVRHAAAFAREVQKAAREEAIFLLVALPLAVVSALVLVVLVFALRGEL